MAILRGERPACVVWNIHGALLRRGEQERNLRNSGLGIVEKGVSAFRCYSPHIGISEKIVWEGGVCRNHKTYQTPNGELRAQTVKTPGGGTWTQEYPVKSRNDLAILEYIVRDAVYENTPAAVQSAQAALGQDGIVVCRLPRSPWQQLLVEWMGIENACLALADYPKDMDRCMNAMAKAGEQAIRFTAESSADIAWSAENITASITSPTLFAQYCAPYYRRAASILHKSGKLYGVHMDGQLAALKKLIADTELDFIEGFTPPPMGDLDLAEALAAWPNKVIWTNFPGNVFCQTDRQVMDYTLDLLRVGCASGRFMLTIAEDLPNPDRNLALLERAVARFKQEWKPT